MNDYLVSTYVLCGCLKRYIMTFQNASKMCNGMDHKNKGFWRIQIFLGLNSKKQIQKIGFPDLDIDFAEVCSEGSAESNVALWNHKIVIKSGVFLKEKNLMNSSMEVAMRTSLAAMRNCSLIFFLILYIPLIMILLFHGAIVHSVKPSELTSAESMSICRNPIFCN